MESRSLSIYRRRKAYHWTQKHHKLEHYNPQWYYIPAVLIFGRVKCDAKRQVKWFYVLSQNRSSSSRYDNNSSTDLETRKNSIYRRRKAYHWTQKHHKLEHYNPQWYYIPAVLIFGRVKCDAKRQVKWFYVLSQNRSSSSRYDNNSSTDLETRKNLWISNWHPHDSRQLWRTHLLWVYCA